MEKTNITRAATNMNKKTTKGRKKIPIKKIEEQNSRQVTFSKRRNGLFKKASELCVLTGAQVAIVVSSPAGRVYAFGHPDADDLIETYINNNNNANINTNDTKVVPTKEFNQHYVEVSKELEAEKKRKEMIPTTTSNSKPLAWYEKEVDGMDVKELEEYLYSLGELKKKLLTRADELLMINQTPALFGPRMGWNNNGNQPVPNKDIAHAGFKFQHGGLTGKF